jgi:hypothetical protein
VQQPNAFAAGGYAPQPAAPAWNPPAPVAVAPADPAHQEMKNRLQSIQQKVTQAAEAAQKLHAAGKLTGELADSPTKMQQYLSGAMQSLESRDLNSAKGFADWAEYEASRLLAVR